MYVYNKCRLSYDAFNNILHNTINNSMVNDAVVISSSTYDQHQGALAEIYGTIATDRGQGTTSSDRQLCICVCVCGGLAMCVM